MPGLGEDGVVGEERVHEVHDGDHVGRSLVSDLAGELAGVVAGGLHRVGEVEERALLVQRVDPRAVESDDIRKSSRSRLGDGLGLQRGEWRAEELHRDGGVLLMELIHEALKCALGHFGSPPL